MQEEFAKFRVACIPSNAPPAQVEDLRRAFYGGALAFNHLVMGGLSSEDGSSPQDEQFMSDLIAELVEFGADRGIKFGQHGKN